MLDRFYGYRIIFDSANIIKLFKTNTVLERQFQG